MTLIQIKSAETPVHRSWSQWLAAFVVGLVLLLQSAQVSAAEQGAAAEALFRSALEAASKGDWQTACARFKESYRLESTAGTALNIGRCSEKLDNVATAWRFYGEVSDTLSDSDPRRSYAQKKVTELEAELPRLVLVADPNTPSGAIYRIDSVAVSEAVLGVPLPQDPGAHILEVEVEGNLWREEVSVEKGETREVRLGLPVVAVQEKDTPLEPSEKGSSNARRTWGTVLLSVGGAGAAVGVFGAVWAGVELGKYNQECSDGCSSGGIDASSRGKSAVYTMIGGFSVAAVGITTGVLLWRGSKKNSSAEVSLALEPRLGGGSVGINGQF